MKSFPLALIGACLGAACAAASARPAAVVDQREAHQEQRIQQGIANGSVSAREA